MNEAHIMVLAAVMRLPRLPEPDSQIDSHPYRSANQMHQIQREAAIWAIEEAAKVCKEIYGLRDWIIGDTITSQCARAIRALKEKIE